MEKLPFEKKAQRLSDYTLGKWKKTAKGIERLRQNLTINPTPDAKTHNLGGTQNWKHLPEEPRVQTPCQSSKRLKDIRLRDKPSTHVTLKTNRAHVARPTRL